MTEPKREKKRTLKFDMIDGASLTESVMNGSSTTGDLLLIASAAIIAAINKEPPDKDLQDRLMKFAAESFLTGQMLNGYHEDDVRAALRKIQKQN